MKPEAMGGDSRKRTDPLDGLSADLRGRNRSLVWLPIPIVWITVAAIWLVHPQISYPAPWLLLILNLVFSALASFLIAFLMGGSYLMRGTPDLLLVGCGLLIWGTAGISGGAIGPYNINANVTTYDVAACLAAICHLAGATLPGHIRRTMAAPGLFLAAAYAISVCAVGLIAKYALLGQLPVFFVEDQGGTVLRQVVLSSAIVMFVIASIVLRIKNRGSQSLFLRWYTLALLLIAAGLFGILASSSFDSLLSWTGRTAQYLGGLYMLVAAIACGRDSREWVISLDTTLMETMQRYEDLFHLSADGIIVHEPPGGSVPGRIRQANSAASALLGYNQDEIRHLTVLDLVPVDDRPSVRRHAAAAGEQAVVRHEKTLLTKDGRPVVAEMTSRLFYHRNRPMMMSVIRDISERRRAEETLRESEERFHSLADNLPQLAWMADKEGWIVWYNRRWYEYTGSTFEEMQGWGWQKVHHPDHVERVVSGIRRCFETGEIWEDTFPLRGKDGGYRWFLSRAIPIHDSEGRVVQWFGTSTDLTDRLEAERRLRESEERLRLTLSAAQIGTFEYRPQTGETVMDARSKALWGVAPDAEMSYVEVVGRIHPDDRQRFTESVESALDPASSGMYELEFRIRWPDGSVHWQNAKGRVYFEGVGSHRRAARMVGIQLDSTERKLAEQALSDAMQRLGAHIDNSPLAVIEFDPDFRVTRWSAEARKLFGWAPQEILGKAIPQVHWVYEDDADKVAAITEDMRRGKRPRNVSVNRNYRRDGSVIECEWYNSAIYDGEGRLSSVLSQVLDVTDRKRTEERLRQAHKMESIAQLAGGVAHDFNNLLVGVIGNASLAMEILPPGNPAANLLEGIIRAGEQAAHLTKQMLAYSGKGKFVMESVDVSEVVRDVIDLVRSTAPRRIVIRLHLEPDLPPIEADRSQIHQILMNLVINATEAIGGNPGLIDLRVGVRQVDWALIAEMQGADLVPGRYVSLEVHDTGPGMDEATKGKIFDPFFTTKFQGRGLGLAAVAGIVRSHRGALRVESAPERGTSFLVLLPAIEAPKGSPPRVVSESGQHDLAGCGTVLVADDEEPVQTAARLALQHRGCSVLVAGSGSEALDLMKRAPERISLVILDLSMPGMSGEEVLPRLLEIKPGLDVIVSSGYAEAEVLRRFAGMPVAGFIQKPYTAREIAEKVKATLARRTVS